MSLKNISLYYLGTWLLWLIPTSNSHICLGHFCSSVLHIHLSFRLPYFLLTFLLLMSLSFTSQLFLTAAKPGFKCHVDQTLIHHSLFQGISEEKPVWRSTKPAVWWKRTTCVQNSPPSTHTCSFSLIQTRAQQWSETFKSTRASGPRSREVFGPEAILHSCLCPGKTKKWDTLYTSVSSSSCNTETLCTSSRTRILCF